MSIINAWHKSPRKSTWKALVLCLLAAAAATVLFLDTAWAQGEPYDSYVDLVMLYEYQVDEDVEYSVQNNGTATATGVSVSFLLEDLQAGASFTFASSTITPIITDKETVDTTNQRFTWVIGNIPPGSASRTLVFRTVLHSGHTSTGRIGSISAEASSASPEPDVLLDNNVKKFYSYADTSSGNTLHMRFSWLALLLSVDDLRPAAGDDLNFDLTALNAQGGGGDSIGLIADAKVKVELSDGLEFKGSWTPPATFVKSGSQSATWSPPDTDARGTDTTFPESGEIEIQTQLTSDSLDDIPLKDRCITARVTDSIPPPSADYLLGSLKQCLGDDPLVLLKENQWDLFTLEPTAQNDLELVTVAGFSHLIQLRSHGIARTDNIDGSNVTVKLDPEKFIIQVKDSPSTRGSVTDNSVTSMTWQTKGGDVGSGVEVRENVQPILDLGVNNSGVSTVWSDGQDKLTASGIGTASKPGTVRIFDTGETFKLADADSPAFSSALPFGTGGYVSTTWVLHFGTLGTYELGRTYKGTHSTAGTKTTDEETYTFHVGPIAELEVRDGGANPGLPASQRAYTVMAVNNGPDDAPAAQVTLTNVPSGSTVGSISHGSYNAATGVWTIGVLETAEYRRVTGQREGAVLTLLTSAAEGTEITATITNTKEYEVCIDSSGGDVKASSQLACEGPSGSPTGNTWHTTKYYDYNEGNSTNVTIAARPGSGGSALRTSQSTVGIGLSWTPQEGAAAYGIEVSEDGVAGWRLLEPWRAVRDASYTHTGIPVGATRHYRVHAIDSEGRRSLPFASSSASALAGRAAPPSGPAGPPMNVSAARSETDPAGTIRVSWDAPLNDGGSRITGYVAQWSATGTEGWSDACSAGAAERSCEHTGLSGDGPRYYRVAARNASGLGTWSHPPAEVARQPGDCDVPAVTADGSPVAGSWGDDCESAERQGRQARYYQFTLADSADVTVRLESDGARPVLYLRKGAGVTSGAHIGFNEGEAEYDHRRASIEAGLTAGTYTIEAATYAAGETGDFTLTVSQAVGCHARKVTTDGSPAAGSWGGDCESTAREGRQARYYQFTLADSAYVTVRLESEDTETVLYLREGAGVTSGETTPAGFNEGESEYDYLRASIEESLEPGTYTIEATTYAAGETGDFTLAVSRAIGCEAVEAPADGSPVAGSWGGDCESTEREGRQARYYQFTLAESADVTVRLASDDAATVLYLREGAGVTSGATTPGGFNDGEQEYDYRRATIEESLEPGTYTIEATTYAAGETGDFTLTVSRAGATGGPAPSGCEVADVTADGSPAAGSWGADCQSTAREGRQARYYQFTLDESADITVRLASGDAETVLYLREGAGVTSGDTTPNGFNEGEREYDYHRASIEESLEPGTYTIEATTYAAGETGDFTLTVSLAGGQAVDCEVADVAADGSQAAGSWGADCVSTAREGRQARYYQFTLDESADITVRLASDDAETVLYLREGAGNTSGATTPGGFNEGERDYDYHRASIEQTLEAGTYTIEATTYAAGETGDFTLTVIRAGGAGSGTAQVTTGDSQARTLDAPALLRFTSAGQYPVSLAWNRTSRRRWLARRRPNPRRRGAPRRCGCPSFSPSPSTPRASPVPPERAGTGPHADGEARLQRGCAVRS